MGFEIWKRKKGKIPTSSGQNDLRRATPMSKTSLNSIISNITLDEIKRSSKQRWQDANRKSQLIRSTCKCKQVNYIAKTNQTIQQNNGNELAKKKNELHQN